MATILVRWSDDPDEAEYRGTQTDRIKGLRVNGNGRDHLDQRFERLPMMMPGYVTDLMDFAAKVYRHSMRN
jgi:hypothetical protein